LAERYKITPFELFCAYHLGITRDGGYQFQNIHDVAKRFGCPSGVIKQLLAEFDMDADAIVQAKYDMASAQVDIMTAPEGISRQELARQMFDDFKKAPRRARDWAAELAEDARVNEQTFRSRSAEPRSPDRGTPGASPGDRGTRRGPRS
jgi:hypothetical protein